jgi:hypothetical protein
LSILRNQYAEQKDRDAVDHAFYAAATGDPDTAPVQFSVLVAANAQLLKTYPEHLKKVFQAQTAATVKELGKLPTPQQVSELSKGIAEVRDAYRNLQAAGGMKQDSGLVKWAKRVAIAAVVGLIAFFLGHWNADQQANAQLLNALKQSSSPNLTTVLRSSGGDIETTRIERADGKTVDGIIIRGGTFKLDYPVLYSDNSVRIPLKP